MNRAKMTRKHRGLLATVLAGIAMLAAVTTASAADPLPQTWRIQTVQNTSIAPSGISDFIVQIENVGDAPTDGSEIALTGSLPTGLTVKKAVFFDPASGFVDCTDGAGQPIDPGVSTSVKCAGSLTVFTDAETGGINWMQLKLTVAAGPVPVVTLGNTLTAGFEVSGGGAAPDSTVGTIKVAEGKPPFGIDTLDALIAADAAGNPYTKAGGHPHDFTVNLDFNSYDDPRPIVGSAYPVEPVKDVIVDLPPGFVGNPTVADQCTADQLAFTIPPIGAKPLCPATSQVGTITIRFNGYPVDPSALGPYPVYNMVPPPGSPARFGLNVFGTVVVLDARLREDYSLAVDSRNISQALAVSGAETTFWGVPSAAEHERERACPGQSPPFFGGGFCPSGAPEEPFFRMPTSCQITGLPFTVRGDSWLDPGDVDSATVRTHEPPGFPLAEELWGDDVGVSGCEDVPVTGSLEAQPTTLDVESASGLAVRVEVPNAGLTNKDGISASDIKRVRVALPQGMTINPSQAEGLGVCSASQFATTELTFYPTDKGCPDDSKIGTVEVQTPLLEERIPGNVYVAKPYDNPFDSLLAIYIVLAEPERGILVKLPGEVRTNARTGRIEAEFDDLPQFPFSTFDFKFREGARAPLVTPPTCGTYETVTEIEGHSDPGNTITSRSSFQITRGIGGAPCPPGGIPGFKPGFSAGSVDPNAGAFSPFVMRLTRKDGEQDMTRFSATLPPGVLGKLAGVEKCPQSAIAIAKSKNGTQEQQSPSCPANSEIGRSLVGAGVGSVLTYVPGKIYLGGPFNGRPLSVIAITPVVAGPFDVGTVAVQVALTLNPKTAEVEVDGSASDPIPHILKGIPAKLRDLRVYVDRPKFTLNPTSCDPSATDAELVGGGGNAFTTADDVPVFLQDRFQAANCASLGFKPKLGLKLKGGTTRGDFPGLQATYRPRSGDANVEGLVVRLPRSAFLEQGHIRTICTRVQFAADACPKASQYGYIKAWTPLLDEPLAGPVYLRSSNHKLPDLVFDLHGLVDVEVATRIDSIRGGVRASVESVPDAPLTKVVLRMQGGKKGLIVNSRNLCTSTNKANVESDGHNGKISDFNPVMKPDCGKAKKRHGKRRG